MNRKDTSRRSTFGERLAAHLLPYLLAAVVLLVLVVLLMVQKKGSWTDIFRSRPVQVERTKAVVEDIRSLSELTTACYYEEIVLKGNKGSDEIVLIAKGTIRAGVDLGRMETNDLKFSGDTAYVHLPEPQYLDIIINPSDYEIFVQKGTWNDEQVNRVKAGARNRLVRGAEANNVRGKSGQYARESVESLLRGLGVKEVVFMEVPLVLSMPSGKEL